MGIQSFHFPTNPIIHSLEAPTIFIANKDKRIIGSTRNYDDLSITCNLNAYQTASFKIYRDLDGKRQEYYDCFEEAMLIMILGIAWFEIHVETNIDDTGISKTISATSLECKLCDKRLVDFECNAGEILYDDYVKTIFYDPANPKGSLLDRVLNVSPNWIVGHVDDSLANLQRTFDVDDTDVYSFLTGEVSEAFNCLFIFDTFNQTVNAYDLENYGNDTNIFVSTVNLAQSMTQTIDTNSIFTCYRVNGGEGVYINEVNPNGTNKIYNFEYYLPQMPIEIQEKVNEYNDLYQELKSEYENIMSRMQAQVDIIQELITRLPSSLTSKDWTQYGLTFLKAKQKSFKTQDELYCAQGMNNPQSLSYNLYLTNLQDLNAVTAELNVRQSEIDSTTSTYNSVKAERDELQERLDMDNWFTKEEWKSLDNYVIETTYNNDNYIVTDQEDDSERFEIERQLYDVAWKDLSKKCRPQYQYSATLSNLLQIPEFENFKEKFELGNFMRMQTDYNTIVKLRIISFTINYSSSETIDVTFSDAIRIQDVYEDSASIQAQANSAAMSFKFNKDQYDSTVKQGNWVAEMRKYGLDVATTAIHNSSNQVQTWDSTGMTFRQWNDERQDYDPEMSKIINNMMVFSDDSMQTVRMGIGKIYLPNGEYSYGINGETILGKLFLGEYLTLENDSGTYKFDDAGFIATNGINTIKIQPNNSGELFSIYNGNDKRVYIDSSGNAHFCGDITGSQGVFSGELFGGSINIGNGTFTVDKDGNMYASNCTISGEVTSATISSSNISGTTISGGSINIGTGFTVDSQGNIKSVSGEFVSATFKNTLFYGLDYNGQTISYPIINVPSQGNVTFGTNHIHTTFPGSVQVDSSCICNRAYVKYCNDSDDTAIPNVLWVNSKILTTTPTSDSTSTDKAPSYYACANMITNIQNWVNSQGFSKTSGISGISVSAGGSGTITKSGSSNYFWGTTYGGTLSSCSGISLKLPDSDPYSDVRVKNNISEMPDISEIYNRIKLYKFKYQQDIVDTDDLWHWGILAQPTEELFNEYGYTLDDFSLIRKNDPNPDLHEDRYVKDKIYRVTSNEFHAMHIQMIQKLCKKTDEQKEEIESLKQQNISLEGRIAILEQIVNQLIS